MPEGGIANINRMGNEKIDARVNCRGQICPLPVLKLKKALDSLGPGQVLEMVATDPGAGADVRRFLDRMGHELLESRDENSTCFFYIRKK